MKLFATVIMLCLLSMGTFAQQALNLKIKEGADRPNSEPEQLYLLEISNPNRKASTFTIKTSNVNCKAYDTSSQVELQQTALDKGSRRNLNGYTLQPNESYEFYVKISKSFKTAKNKWNCTEVVAIGDNGKPVSNTIIITSLVPDFRDQH